MRAQASPVPHKPNCKCPPCRFRRGEGPASTPHFTVRLPQDVQEWIREQPEGARAYLERLVGEDRERRQRGEPQE